MRGLKRLAAMALTLCLLATMLPTMVSAQSDLPEKTSNIIAAKKAQAEAAMDTEGIAPQKNVNILRASMRTVTPTTTANYSSLRNYVSSYGTTDSDGYKRITQYEYSEGYDLYFSLINVSSGIIFQIIMLGSERTRVDVLLEFTLKSESKYISVEGIAVYYENGAELDGVDQTITIDRSAYVLGDKLPFTGSGYFITSGLFAELMCPVMAGLCEYWNEDIAYHLGFDMVGLGFTSYYGACSHSATEIRGQIPVGCVSNGYSGDVYCCACGELVSTGSWIYCVGYHSYSSACDTSCNVCGENRTTSSSHTYTGDCDASCDSCGAIRTTSSKHTFDDGAYCTLCSATFGDVSASGWQFAPVLYAYENDLMAGKGSDADGNIKFDPNNSITREEFVQVLYNAENKPSVSIANKFPDVAESGWYKNAVLWANANNIASGQGDGTFGVGKNITRQDLAVMLYKYATMKGYDLNATTGMIYRFADGASVASYAQTAMDWAVTNGVLSGKGTPGQPINTFRLDPAGTATRAECAAMLKNFMTAFGL